MRKKNGQGRGFSTVLVPTEGGVFASMVSTLRREIPAEDIMRDGVQPDLHLTLVWGLRTDNPDHARRALAGVRPLRLVLGWFDVFPRKESDVLVCRVQPALALAKVREALCDGVRVLSDSFDFQPHVTLFRLRRGAAHRLGLKQDSRWHGMLHEADRVIFKDYTKRQTVILLHS